MGGLFTTLKDAFTGGGDVGIQNKNWKENQELEQAAKRRKDTEDEIAFSQHIQDLGATPVINGMVKRRAFNMGNPGMTSQSGIDGVAPSGSAAPPTDGYVLDKPDNSRVVKHKTADGETVQWELPSTEEQMARQTFLRQKQLKEGQPVTDLENQQKQATAEAGARGTAQGTGEGKTAAEVNDLNTRGIPLTPDEQGRMGVPAAQTKVTPEQASTLGNRAQIADVKNAGYDKRAQLRAGTQTSIAQMRDRQAQEKLDAEKEWKDFEERGRNQRFGAGEAGKNNRFGQNQARLQQDSRMYMQAMNQAHTEENRAMQAAGLLAESTEQPGAIGSFFGQGPSKTSAVQDGETFLDPYTNKNTVMNAFQRTRLQGLMNSSYQNMERLKSTAGAVRGRYATGDATPAGAQQPAPAGAPKAAPQSATPAAAPAAAAGGPQGAPSRAGKIRVQKPDGTTGWIPKANVAAAQKLGVKVLP